MPQPLYDMIGDALDSRDTLRAVVEDLAVQFGVTKGTVWQAVMFSGASTREQIAEILASEARHEPVPAETAA